MPYICGHTNTNTNMPKLIKDPIKKAQRKAARKMRKDMKNAPVFPGPTRKTKRKQNKGLRQMRKQQLR